MALLEAPAVRKGAVPPEVRHIDTDTAVPLELYITMLAAAREAEGRGQHRRVVIPSHERSKGVQRQLVLNSAGPTAAAIESHAWSLERFR